MTDITHEALVARKFKEEYGTLYRVELESGAYLYASTKPINGVHIWVEHEGVDIDTKGTNLADLDNLIKLFV